MKEEILKKYFVYWVIVTIGMCINLTVKHIRPEIDTFSIGLLTGGIAVIPLWKGFNRK